jgi:4-diphosphocytidyl-2-C-methyl-D-erythritol kinase
MADMTLRARAPAKLNLCLYVGPRRSDGLHEICSLFQPIKLADEVVMEIGVGDPDEVVCPGVEGENLAAVALARFRERFSWDGPPVRITIEKRIPVAAGLGGGSTDAAAVLRLATIGSRIPARLGELLELAPSIGADVPSQVEPGAQLVLGAGEVVERLPKQWHIAAVLLTNERGLSTAEVYAAADRLGSPRHDLAEIEHQVRSATTSAAYSPLGFMAELLQNDLQQAAIELEPSAGEAVELLRSAGAEVALVAGSGPTAFGLFLAREQAESARAALAARWSGQVIVVDHAPSDYAIVRSD